MSFRPARKSVAAVARMMKYITTFEKAMPVKTSWRASRSSWSLAPRRSATVRRPLARSSSTSCEACQKNRYGEIVVPRMPTSVGTARASQGTCGTSVSRRAADQFGCARTADRMYAKSTAVSHLSQAAKPGVARVHGGHDHAEPYQRHPALRRHARQHLRGV